MNKQYTSVAITDSVQLSQICVYRTSLATATVGLLPNTYTSHRHCMHVHALSCTDLLTSFSAVSLEIIWRNTTDRYPYINLKIYLNLVIHEQSKNYCGHLLITVDISPKNRPRLASFPGRRPASRRLQYGKVGEDLVHFLT